MVGLMAREDCSWYALGAPVIESQSPRARELESMTVYGREDENPLEWRTWRIRCFLKESP